MLCSTVGQCILLRTSHSSVYPERFARRAYSAILHPQNPRSSAALTLILCQFCPPCLSGSVANHSSIFISRSISNLQIPFPATPFFSHLYKTPGVPSPTSTSPVLNGPITSSRPSATPPRHTTAPTPKFIRKFVRMPSNPLRPLYRRPLRPQ
jgi:hypothetical protein